MPGIQKPESLTLTIPPKVTIKTKEKLKSLSRVDPYSKFKFQSNLSTKEFEDNLNLF